MEHLTKQQIVLLTLFTSFVTSIATGIVTVALVDQAPTGVTSTVNHVIEHTIEEVTSSGSATNAGTNDQTASVSDAAANVFLNSADQIKNATALVQKSFVRIMVGNNVTGLGVVVASSGIIISDKSTVEGFGEYAAITSDGTRYPLQILQLQNNGNIVFLFATNPSSSSTPVFTSAHLASLATTNQPALGETVIALSATDPGASSVTVTQGIIRKINMTTNQEGVVDASSTISSIETSIDSSEMPVGAILFDSTGTIIGMKTLSNESGNFYPIGYLQAIIPAI